MKKEVVEGKALAWSTSSYKALEPNDLAPHPAPTPEQRIRVAAALATWMRDEAMTDQPRTLNAESIRAVLVMDADAWARDIGSIGKIVRVYDAEDPKKRFEQIKEAYS